MTHKTNDDVDPIRMPAASATTASEHQRMARINALRDKRKPLEATDVSVRKKLKMTPVLYPSGEETQQPAELEHKDPDTKEAKRKRRLIRNRMSAQLHRERKKTYVSELEDQLQAKESEIKALQNQLAARTAESEELKKQLATCTCRRTIKLVV